jgi:uncharacterized membrane protein YkoI
MTIHVKRHLAAAAVAVGLAVGSAGVAAAVTGTSSPQAVAPAVQSTLSESQAEVPGSEAADPAESTGQSEADEAAALATQAVISEQQAIDAAVAATGGTAGGALLEDENGTAIYAVEITLGDGSLLDVKVDAASGAVLAQDSSDGIEADEAAGTEAPEGTEAADASDTDNIQHESQYGDGQNDPDAGHQD